MFTGIIQKLGSVEDVQHRGSHGQLRVRGGAWDPPLVLGESIAVEGVCLTVTCEPGEVITFDLLKETFDRTNLGSKGVGDRVNLERALRMGDALGGHFVTGHVDGTGHVRRITPVGRDHIIEVACAAKWMAQMVGKGSIAVCGVSLTLVDLMPDGFSVHLIPHTWENTTLGDLKLGSPVNLETDMLGKYVERAIALRMHDLPDPNSP
ncbi:MAG: riboflavin synthase [Kiritimatiellae bacterium]|nr:riboflavin synthase [Kiritimatiellia bacterium]